MGYPTPLVQRCPFASGDTSTGDAPATATPVSPMKMGSYKGNHRRGARAGGAASMAGCGHAIAATQRVQRFQQPFV